MKFRIHTIKFLISSAVAVFCIFLGLYFLVSKYLAAGLVFLVIGCVYTVPAYQLGGTVSVDLDGVTVTHLFGGRQYFAWKDIQETGIIGIKVLNQNNPKSTGPKYIYFSKKVLTRDARFEAALKWPPADMIHMWYSYQRLKAVRKYWKEPITLYNTGNLVVDPPIKE